MLPGVIDVHSLRPRTLLCGGGNLTITACSAAMAVRRYSNVTAKGSLLPFVRDEVLQTSQVDCIRKDKLEFAYQMSFDGGPCWERVHGVTS